MLTRGTASGVLATGAWRERATTEGLAWIAALLLTLLAFGMVRRAKTGPDRALYHPYRRLLFDMIRRKPGVRQVDLQNVLQSHRGTTQYHLLILERIGAVKSVAGHNTRRYFPGAVQDATLNPLALLMRGRVWEVVQSVLAVPGRSQEDLTAELHMSRKVFREYANQLLQQQLVTEFRDARRKRYYPTNRLHEVLEELEQAAETGPDWRPPRGPKKP